MRTQGWTSRQLQGGSVGSGRAGGAGGPRAVQPGGCRVGVGSACRAVQEAQGLASSGAQGRSGRNSHSCLTERKKTGGKKRALRPPSPLHMCSLRFCGGRGISRKEEEEKEEDVWFAGQPVLPHGAEQVVVSQADTQSGPVLLFSCTL